MQICGGRDDAVETREVLGVQDVEPLDDALQPKPTDGVGSGSMLAACTGGLVAVVPDQEQLILALAAASNILTYATGLYVGLFIALPLTEWLYKISRPSEARSA